MVDQIRKKYGFDDSKVLAAMLRIPREEFVPNKYRGYAYRDSTIPIGQGQTISQPYTVAYMTSLLNLRSTENVLEVGTGSGYQTAVLSLLAKEVYSIEIIEELAQKARILLKRLGFKNVAFKLGSGEWGWKEKAPFDAIIVTAGLADNVPSDLIEQLSVNGVLVAPLGKDEHKKMVRLTKTSSGVVSREELRFFQFVPFVRELN